MTTPNTRIERDSMGEMQVPADALYGASTMRAVLNFPISDLRFPRQFIRALGLIKLACAQTYMDLGALDPTIGNAIVQAAQEVADGQHDDHFVLDIFQTGSGTSTNTNANEVIANRATQILGGDLGSRLVHPNDNVNLGQSSNDVIPTAIHLAALLSMKEDLIPALEELRSALQQKSDEFWPIVKTGRTHLQDATPVRLGQEFSGYAGQAEYSIARVRRAEEALAEVALGGTAVGTGVNTHPGIVRAHLRSPVPNDRRNHPGNREPLPGSIRTGRHRRGQRPDENRRHQFAQDRQRHPVPGLRSPRRARGNQRA